MERKNLILIIIILFILIVASFLFVSLYKIGVREKPDPLNVQCAFACDTQQKVAFCSVERKINGNLKATCEELSRNSQYSRYNVQACPSISCEPTIQETDKTCVTGLNSLWVAPTSEGTCPLQEGKFSRKRNSSDNPPIENQICCFYYE